MPRKVKSVDFTTGEIQDEINARADARVESLLHSDVVFRHPFSRLRVSTTITTPSMTHQSHAESCDINAIVRQYDRTGLLPPATKSPQYADVSNLQGRDLTDLINDAKETAAAVEAERREAVRAAAAQAAPTGDKPSSQSSEATPLSSTPTQPVATPPPAGGST